MNQIWNVGDGPTQKRSQSPRSSKSRTGLNRITKRSIRCNAYWSRKEGADQQFSGSRHQVQLISELHNPGETKAHDKNNTTANQKLSLEETKSKLSGRMAFGEVAIQLNDP